MATLDRRHALTRVLGPSAAGAQAEGNNGCASHPGGVALGTLERAFGLVVFEVAGAELAREFMQIDPAIMAGAMSATLHRHSVAQQRK